MGNSYKRNIIHLELAIVPNHLLIDQERNHTGENLLRNKCMKSFMKSTLEAIMHIIGNSYKKNIVHCELAIVPVQLLIDQERNHTGESL